MYEVMTDAIVLEKQDLREQDSRVFLYTKDFGKIVAKATSSRKITSKLAAHLEPLNYVTVRLISKGDAFEGRGFQVADALLLHQMRHSDAGFMRALLQAANAVNLLVPEAVRDNDLWLRLHAMREQKAGVAADELLRFFGFDPEFAECEFCRRTIPNYFFPKNHFFICHICFLSSRIERKDLVAVRA